MGNVIPEKQHELECYNFQDLFYVQHCMHHAMLDRMCQSIGLVCIYNGQYLNAKNAKTIFLIVHFFTCFNKFQNR